MYGGTCAVMWIEYLRKHNGKTIEKTKLAVLAWAAPIVMSGVIEILQSIAQAEGAAVTGSIWRPTP